jgi:large subunit ribosomal protein L6
MSRVGKQSILLPEKVSVKVDDNGLVTVEGPKGKLEYTLPTGITLKEEDGQIIIERASEDRKVRALHGTARSLVNNMVIGVSTGFTRDLEIPGAASHSRRSHCNRQ